MMYSDEFIFANPNSFMYKRKLRENKLVSSLYEDFCNASMEILDTALAYSNFTMNTLVRYYYGREEERLQNKLRECQEVYENFTKSHYNASNIETIVDVYMDTVRGIELAIEALNEVYDYYEKKKERDKSNG